MARQSRYVSSPVNLEILIIADFSKLGQERFWAPEILFNPELIGLEYPGVHQILVDGYRTADIAEPGCDKVLTCSGMGEKVFNLIS